MADKDKGPALCPHCGKPVRAEARMCPHCGRPLRKKCIVCETEMPVTDAFCPNCGARQVGIGASDRAHIAGKAIEVAPGIISAGTGCLIDLIKFLGPTGVIIVVVAYLVNSLTGGLIFNLLFGWVWNTIRLPLFVAITIVVIYQAHKRGVFAAIQARLLGVRQANLARRSGEDESEGVANAEPSLQERFQMIVGPGWLKAELRAKYATEPEEEIAPVVTPPLGTTVICPNCGFSNPPGKIFCDNCGYDLGGPEPTVLLPPPFLAPPPPPAPTPLSDGERMQVKRLVQAHGMSKAQSENIVLLARGRSEDTLFKRVEAARVQDENPEVDLRDLD